MFQQLPWVTNLDEARQGVLANMTFEMGIDGLLEFKDTLLAVQAGDYQVASEEMLKSKWATKDAPARAQRLSLQMATGKWI